MIRFAEISMKPSGAHFDTSFSDKNKTKKPYSPTVNSIKITTTVRQLEQFRFRANAKCRETSHRSLEFVEESGSCCSRDISNPRSNLDDMDVEFHNYM